MPSRANTTIEKPTTQIVREKTIREDNSIGSRGAQSGDGSNEVMKLLKPIHEESLAVVVVGKT